MKKIFSSTLLLVLLMLSFCACIHAEYIVYIDNNGKRGRLTSDQHEKVFELLMKYQFPMSINPGQNLKKELSKDEFQLLCADERAFIENKIISEVDKNAKVEFIPTTLYEVLYTIFLAMQIFNSYDKVSGFINAELSLSQREKCWSELKKFVSLTFISIKNCGLYFGEKEQREACHKIYESARDTHFACNNILLNFYNGNIILSQEKEIDFIKMLEVCMKHLCGLNAKSKEILGEDGYFLYYNSLVRLFANSKDDLQQAQMVEMLKKAVQIELEAAKLGAFVLYRGTNGYQLCIDKLIGSSKGYSGLSYGNSLAAGCINDSAATALVYFKNCIYGYALLVNKKEYFDRESFIRRIADIPPLPTLVGLICSGEAFHPRIYERKLEVGEGEQTFQEYLNKNARIIKNQIHR